MKHKNINPNCLYESIQKQVLYQVGTNLQVLLYSQTWDEVKDSATLSLPYQLENHEF